jgi:hypothetical protein
MRSSPPPAAESPEHLSDIDQYRLVRAQIEFEASLIAQRLSWFVASQAFLFSAYAITLNFNPVRDPTLASYVRQQHLLFRLIPLVAIAACTLIYFAILGGLFAQLHLRQFLARALPPERLAPFPPIQGARSTHLLGLAAPLGLPLAIVAAWILLWSRGLR